MTNRSPVAPQGDGYKQTVILRCEPLFLAASLEGWATSGTVSE